MSQFQQEPHDELQAVVKRLTPILVQYGFHFEPAQNAFSSGGPFESGYFRRVPIEIGIIVRGKTFGLPGYEYKGRAYIAAHNELIEELGRSKDALLLWDEDPLKPDLAPFTADGREVLDAFISDLESIILPVLKDAPERIYGAIMAAHKKRIDFLMSR